MRIAWLALIIWTLSAAAALSQPDPVAGQWRGSIKNATGSETTLVLTLGKSGDRYVGTTNGLTEGADVALRSVAVAGTTVTVEVTSESRLGQVALGATLTVQGTTLAGDGTVTIGGQRFPVTLSLQRRQRADVVQHQVDQSADYFTGRWAFDYTGGEFPPLSIGNRKGAVTFVKAGPSPFVTGTLAGDAYGTPFESRLSIGVDAEADMVVLRETRPDGIDLVGLGNWRSPLAVVFTTSPIVQGGRTYVLKRVFSILSEKAFDVSEEFSVDGGPFKRLGAGHFTKQ